jgi:hypothetical protein
MEELMKKLLEISMVVIGLMLPILAQGQRPNAQVQNVSQQDRDDRRYQDREEGRGQRLSPEDQSRFDGYYQKWVSDRRSNDRDDIRKDEQHMQDIMARYNIPSDVPYEQIASRGDAYRDSDGYRDRDDRGYDRWRGRLPENEQRKFDDAYAKWVNDRRKNDRDDVREDEKHMLDIMSRNNIPRDVPFDAVASQGMR